MEGIPDIEGFRQRAKARSDRNWEALEKSGAFAGSLRLLQLELLDAYWHCVSLSPCIAMPKAAFDSFMAAGEFHPFGATLTFSGTVDLASRQEYSRRVYGYDDIRTAEKYGYMPVNDCSLLSAYGDVRVKFKPEVMQRATVLPGDSGSQWAGWESRRFGWLHPLAVGMPDCIGCLLPAPTPNELEDLDMYRDDIAARCKGVIRLLKGMDDSRYVEAHLHGKLTPDDVLSCTAA